MMKTEREVKRMEKRAPSKKSSMGYQQQGIDRLCVWGTQEAL
jgi:hypothetical protein